jgi:putative tryptophan/tyrosine transport system substrate-binding protein
MRRREFITLLSGVAAWPHHVRAQVRSAQIPRLGILQPGKPPEPLVEALQQRLRDLGYVEGKSIAFEYRWALGKLEGLNELAKELVGSNVDVMTTLSTPAALAALNTTRTIPIIFTGVGDPVGAGVVPNLAKPGGNITGISLLATELSAKRLEMLREITPSTSRVAMLWNDTNPSMVLRAREVNQAATKMGIDIHSVGVHVPIDLDNGFMTIESGRADALLTLVDPFTREHRKRIVEFAAQKRLPAMYEAREFVDAGGLISYGPSLIATSRRAAEYIDKVLKGTKPADLPVEQPTKFELVIDMKTVKALGINIPQAILMRADEVIE